MSRSRTRCPHRESLMKHKPFEEWIFLEETLEKEERKSLYDHLRECDECYFLEKNWSQIEPLLVSAPVARPANGFAERWQARLALDRRRSVRRQNIAVLGLTSAGAVFFLVLFALQFYLQIAEALSPIALWLAAAGHAGSLALDAAGDTFRLIMERSPASFSMLLTMAFFASIGTAAVLWLKMFRALARLQGFSQWA